MRPSDCSSYDRPASWASPTSRSRINSSTTIRHFDDKTPFLTPIGYNFDEDERKPLDGVSAPQRTVRGLSRPFGAEAPTILGKETMRPTKASSSFTITESDFVYGQSF